MPKTAKDAVALAAAAQIVDLRFTDLPGIWQHFSIPVEAFTEEFIEEGAGFDGSSIRGFQHIQESDMLLAPDPETAFIDPCLEYPTLAIICNVKDPMTLEPYSRDPRFVAQKAANYLKQAGIGEESYWGPEPEFFILNDVRFDSGPNFAFFEVDSREGIWNSGRDEGPNLGYKVRHKEGYFPVPPMDTLQDIRSEMMLTLKKVGVEVEVHHHEVASAGQCEIDMKYDKLVTMGDRLMIFKYIIKNISRKHGMTATFMPKPIFQDNGSGMHCHQSIWKGNENLFYDEKGYAGLSDMARYYIGGLLKHTAAVLAFAAPTTNAYRRLVPGYEAPVNLVYSQRNRSACVRIPMYFQSHKAQRVEFRCPDPSCNGYLAFAAMLMAGIDGIQNKIDPGPPIDKDLYDLPPEEAKNIKKTPGSLEESLDALEKDHDFLMKGDVFTKDLIDVWIAYKREHEVDAVRLRPHPHEFALYFDI